MIENFIQRAKNNHFAKMAICCALPIIAIIGLQFIGIRENWIYLFAIALCVGAHVMMMARSSSEGKACH